MAKIYIGGAGGAPSNNFINSLHKSKRKDYLVGGSSCATDLFLADVHEKYLVPLAGSEAYEAHILKLLKKIKPNFLHVQNDFEVRAISNIRNEIESLGVKLFMPKHETIESCVDKLKSYAIWRQKGIKVPETILLNCEEGLHNAFITLGKTIWIRAIEGGGGKGALPTDNFNFAKIWIDRFNGWGHFTASELLSKDTVTWQSIWYKGQLIVAQTRRRLSWNFGNRTLSGVTGITGVGETFSDEVVDKIAESAILAIDSEPHGIFSVDMTYDFSGVPNPTEINISRFFTTHYFFTEAGINFPEIYVNLGLEGIAPQLTKKINPLPDGLLWIRGMDVEPVLVNLDDLKTMEATFNV
jgi:hypothetical protein